MPAAASAPAPRPVPVPAPGAAQRIVFISYAADDPAWPAATVCALAKKLAERGVDARLDQWQERDLGRRPSDAEWRTWMQASLDAADHVLCLSSARYVELASRPPPTPGAPPSGRGVAFEAHRLEQRLYQSGQHNNGRIFLLLAPDAPEPAFLEGQCPRYLSPAHEPLLLEHLCRPSPTSRHDALRRRMRRLIEEECLDLYVQLSGQQRQGVDARPVLGARVPQSTRRRLQGVAERAPPDPETDASMARWSETEHADVLDALRPDTRALVLGEPGAGKTFALLKVMERDLAASTHLPLWVKLNHWLDGVQSFEAFVASELPELGDDWVALAHSGRCRLLLDGLNELPAEHAQVQAKRMSEWLQAHPACPVLLSCREGDAPQQTFAFLPEQLSLRALRAAQVRQFVHQYLGTTADEAAREQVFWQIAGEALQEAWQQRPASTAEAVLDDLVDGRSAAPLHWLSADAAAALERARQDPARPYSMATNPYLLAMLLWVWADEHANPTTATTTSGAAAHGRESPAHPPLRRRVEVFDRYTRERLLAEVQKTHSRLGMDDVQEVLTTLAARLQQVAERTEQGRDAGNLALPWAELPAAEQPALHLALGARLLRREGALLRFRHQLLHEFYVSRHLRRLLPQGPQALLQATWGAQPEVWQRSGWLQPFLLLAETQHTDVPALLRTLVLIQPEVAGAVWAQARQQSPALLSEALAEEMCAALLPQMLPSEPSAGFPKREAAFGRGLGLMRLPDGRPLDRRPGVAGWYSPGGHTGQAGRPGHKAQVDIDWVPIPAGPFVYQGERRRNEHAYAISRYPITHSQFQAFVDDPHGWPNPHWWGRAPAAEQRRQWRTRWAHGNHPCTHVSWWAATAYARWLAALRGEAIALPSELQWERAAAGTEGAEYPWGDNWGAERANAENGIGQTSFCGLYRAEASAEGVHELAGNVWEWTADRYGPSEWQPRWMLRVARLTDRWRRDARRAVRGGSWSDPSDECRASFRHGGAPGIRFNLLGFRVVCCPIIEP